MVRKCNNLIAPERCRSTEELTNRLASNTYFLKLIAKITRYVNFAYSFLPLF